jgi:hypothetical protein
MDLDKLHSNTKKKRKKKKRSRKEAGRDSKKAFRPGRPTVKDEDFIKDNYQVMTDTEMADVLGRSKRSVQHIRTRLGLEKKKGPKERVDPNKARESYVNSLEDDEKRTFFLKELRKSSMYKAFVTVIAKDPVQQKYVAFYEQKYIDFMTDPSVETMTSPERDIWHEMTMAQIRELQYIRKEHEEKKTIVTKDGAEIEIDYDFSREINQCQETIRKCHESLNVTRAQRLKNANDSAVNFTEVIKELRHPEIRRKVGDQAAMFKYIAERHYNDHLGQNIISGNSHRYDVDQNFKNGEEPRELDGDFTGEKTLKEIEEQKVSQKKQEEQGLVATTGEEEQTTSSNDRS